MYGCIDLSESGVYDAASRSLYVVYLSGGEILSFVAVIVMESVSASELYMRASKSCIKMQLILVDICKAKKRILGMYNSAVMCIIPFFFYDKKNLPISDCLHLPGV